MHHRSLAGAAVSVVLVLFAALVPTNSMAQVAAGATIFVRPDSAHPGDLITISGRDGDADGSGPCDLTVTPDGADAFDNDLIGGGCAVDDAGSISGSFSLPADLGQTTVMVEVCVSICRDGGGPSAVTAVDVEPVVEPVVEPSISVSPNPARPSDTVTITGSGPASVGGRGCGLWVAPGDGDAFDNENIGGSCAIDDEGNISGSFVVPADLGQTTLTVQACVGSCLDSETSGPAASASLDVEPLIADPVEPTISVSPSPAHPSDTVTITGSGPGSVAEGGCGLRVGQADGDAFDNELISGSCAIDDAGTISGSFVVPADLGRTTLTVGVCVASCLDVDVPGPVASASLGVEPVIADPVIPVISVSPNSAHPSDTVTISGSGPGSVAERGCGLRVSPADGDAFDNDTIGGSCAIDDAGTISGSFAVPADLGRTTLTVEACVASCLDADVPGPVASASLEVEPVIAGPAVEPSISVSPSPAHPSDTVTISGSGPGSVAERGCGLRVSPADGDAFDNDTIGGSCAIDDAGTISGSFAVPADLGQTTLTVGACVASCLDVDVPGPVASTSLVVEPVAVGPTPAPSISVNPTTALPGGSVTIAGNGPGSGTPASCDLAVDGGATDAACAVDGAGAITGSFTVPAEAQPGSVTVAVCETSCQGTEGTQWRASALLAIGSTPVSSTAATDEPAATVRIPDVTSMTVQDAEKVIFPPNRFLPAAIAAVVMLMIGGLALTVRYRVRRRRELRWVDEHVDLIPLPGFRVNRAQPADPDGVDHEIKVVVNPQDDMVSVLEVQR